MNNQLLIQRESHEEVTFAVIQYAGCEADQLLARLRQAVARWQQTTAGSRAMQDACGDFNVGDLSNYTPAGKGWDSTQLSRCLAEVGITYLDIDAYSQPHITPDWDFDTRLG